MEGGARVLAWQRQRKVLADWERLASAEVPPAEVVLDDSDSRLGRLVRTSADPRIVYEFLPRLRARFRGQRCEFNSQGFRGAEWPPPERTPGTLRIAGLGDSVMFGWGIAEQDTFLRVLERDLSATAPGGGVEVLNTGVPGYNTAMEVATFERKVLPYRPDIVLIDYVGNDADLPNLIANQSDPFALDRLFAYDLWRQFRGRYSQFGDHPLQVAPFSGTRFESDPDRVPPIYRDMVGEAGVVRALRRLHELSQQHTFHLAVTCHYELPPYVRAVCDELHLPMVENVANIRSHLRAGGTDESRYLKSDLVLCPTDPHPSVLAHHLFGTAIAASLRREGWIAK